MRLRKKEWAKIHDPGKKPGKWTQKYVALKTGIPRTTIGDLEDKSKNTSISYVDLLALIDLFGKELEDFVNEVVKANKM